MSGPFYVSEHFIDFGSKIPVKILGFYVFLIRFGCFVFMLEFIWTNKKKLVITFNL